MTDVGVRELRDSLSRHLAMVREGQTITVTDHGRPVARIVPVGVTPDPDVMRVLHADDASEGL